MEYKVVPFHPTITDKGGSEQVARELQDLIKNMAVDGWKFISLEVISSTEKKTGCGSIFSKPEIKNFQLAIFNK
jgi:hypothetical protein